MTNTIKVAVLATVLAVGALMILASLTIIPATVEAQTSSVYRAARTPDGQPDIQGIWQVLNTAEFDIQDHGPSLGVPPGRAVVENNELPYKPEALAQKEKNYKMRATADPGSKCFYPGVPRMMYIPYPFQIVQTPTYMMMMFEYGHHERLIYTDGFPHHEEIPFWMGDSRGKWEGETFVIDSKNFTNNTWFDRAGNFNSDALHLIERFTRVSPDVMQYEATIDDPKTFTRPWKMRMPFYRRQEPDVQLLEYECYALSVLEGGLYNKMEKPAARRPAAAGTSKPQPQQAKPAGETAKPSGR